MTAPAQGPGGPSGIGEALRRSRIAQGLSLYALAHELNLSVHILEAVEEEDWRRIPPGRERPTTRQIADRLGLDVAAFAEQWRQVPGAAEQEPRDPRQEFLERILMSALTVGTAGLMLWLVVPGRSLRQEGPAARKGELAAGPAPWIPKDPAGPYPVVGEVLPEAPVTEEGALVSMRAMDACEARIQPGDGQPPLTRSLRVSEPWRLRVKGAFTLTLDNAGVVALEVAGRRIRHGRNVGEAWSGQFGDNGAWLIPEEATGRIPPPAPDQEPGNPEME